MPDNDYRLVRMIHPAIYKESGGQSGLAEVPETAVAQHYLAGWALVAEDWSPEAQQEPGAPEPVALATVMGGDPPQDPGGDDAAGDKAATARRGGKATGGRGAGQNEE